MLVIVGLGNPGKKYELTRHNVGFNAIDKIASEYNITVEKNKFDALIGEGVIEDEKVMLVKPQTYMNLSGESIRQILDFYKLSAEDIIVMFDDIDTEVGKIRIKRRGSAGGHNGIKSIIQHVGTNEFMRLKIGIDRRPVYMDLADYVLGKFSIDHKVKVDEVIESTVDIIKCIVTDGIDSAMNKYN